MKSENNGLWLLVAALAVGLSLWHQDQSSGYESKIQQLQKDLGNCKTEFAVFKDGVTYGK